ncbi:MAG: hypothetical protein OXM55_02835 [Bdellovibrionales bacterium]|nr:hypothetical protein [Bdellovibrionales bacterium]
MQNTLFTKLKPYRFRILAGALFCAFLISTWFVFHQKPKYPEELHISLQDQLKNIIQETLVKQKPQAKNLKFQKMWTQSTKKRDQISAHFKYSFDDETDVNISIEGQALMNRKSLGASEKYDLWSVDHIQINNTKMEFSEPITLFSSKFKGKIEEDTEEDEEDEEGEEIEEDDKDELGTQESEMKPSADNSKLTEEPRQAPPAEEGKTVEEVKKESPERGMKEEGPPFKKEMEKEDTDSNQESSPEADEN